MGVAAVGGHVVGGDGEGVGGGLEGGGGSVADVVDGADFEIVLGAVGQAGYGGFGGVYPDLLGVD